MIHNILITGSRNSGKTTLLKELIKELHIEPAGYQTVEREQYSWGSTYAMADLLTGEQGSISVYENGRVAAVEETIASLGTACLKRALASSEQVVVLDELGRFEQKCDVFLQEVFQLLDSQKIILAVLKKESIAYIEQIKRRHDVMLFDLDNRNYDDVKKQLIHHLHFLIKGEKEK